jgi:hypothetical protein
VGDGTLIGSSPAGLINDLPATNTPPDGGIFGFMRFSPSAGLNMYFDLTGVGGFGPGSGVSCSLGNPGVNNSCSIPGSAFLLTQTDTGTSVTLLAHGTILDSGDGTTGPWSGAFTTQINGQSPLAIYDTISTGGSISSTFSGEFDAGVPEPVSMVLIGGGLLALAVIKRRKRV